MTTTTTTQQPSPRPLRPRPQRRRRLGPYALAVLAVLGAVGYVATLSVLLRGLEPPAASTTTLVARRTSNLRLHLHQPPPPPTTPTPPRDVDPWAAYECLGWRQTGGCAPDGPREPENDHNCSTAILHGASGYCELRHRTNHSRTIRVLPMHCESLRDTVTFTCDEFPTLLNYARRSLEYVHDREFSYHRNQLALRRANPPPRIPRDRQRGDRNVVATLWENENNAFFKRGIVMVIYEKLLLGAYVSIRSLRAMGSTLPVEMWYKSTETNRDHPLLKLLVAEYGVYLREIYDPLATRFYTKLHAVYYSAFDNILLLDADNFPVRDPSYLFETKEFLDNGAIFWPDFWKPGNTIFNIHETSFVWDVFGLDYVNMFEQESGQVLINRRMHHKALDVLMYYGFSLPRVHEDKMVAWGDKDLFRFAWMKTNSTFHMITHPAGAAGKMHAGTRRFCGLTIVQHDPRGDIVFLHRNSQKLSEGNLDRLWTHIQDYKHKNNTANYKIGYSIVFPEYGNCWGAGHDKQRFFRTKAIAKYRFSQLESTLLDFAREGINLTRSEASSSLDNETVGARAPSSDNVELGNLVEI